MTNGLLIAHQFLRSLLGRGEPRPAPQRSTRFDRMRGACKGHQRVGRGITASPLSASRISPSRAVLRTPHHRSVRHGAVRYVPDSARAAVVGRVCRVRRQATVHVALARYDREPRPLPTVRRRKPRQDSSARQPRTPSTGWRTRRANRQTVDVQLRRCVLRRCGRT